MSRGMLVSLVLLVGLVVGAGCGGTTWERAVERANAKQQPLIVEFYADWCGPCRVFEQVLHDPEVVRALGEVEVYRYDLDSKVGQHHARRMGVTGVPTVLAVGPDGMPYGILRGAADKARFLEFLAWSRAQRPALAAGR